MIALVALCLALTGLELGTAVMIQSMGDFLSVPLSRMVGVGLVWASLLYVYAVSLSTASLSAVTVGWIVTSQIGAVLVDRFHNHLVIHPLVLVGIAVMLIGVAIMSIPEVLK